MRTSVQLVIGYHFYCCFASFLSIVWDNAPQLQILSSYLCNKKSPYWTIFIAGCGDNAPLCAAPPVASFFSAPFAVAFSCESLRSSGKSAGFFPAPQLIYEK